MDVTGELESSAVPSGSTPVAAGLFMYVSQVRQAEAGDRARQLIAETNAILGQCDLYVLMEVAHVIAVPPHLRTVHGNEVGSWGGHAPDSLGDPDLIAYHENERLTPDARELFAYGKQHSSRNAVTIFVVDSIEYFIGADPTGAAGLAFTPVAFHHADDYPLRNSVLATHTGGELVAHELGHMLLNSGDHWGEGTNNLMLGPVGSDLTADQCDRMRQNRERLFGDDAIPDPGPPTTTAASIAVESGGGQLGKAGETLELPFVVRVTDAGGEGVGYVHVYWSVTSGGGLLEGRPASRTTSDGVGKIRFLPTMVGTSTVAAEVVGLDAPPVMFAIDAPILVITLRPRFDAWVGGYVGDPSFLGPEGGSEVTVPVGTTVEWLVRGVELAHIASISEPAIGEAFDSGSMADGDRFQFVPNVAGTWAFEDQISGTTGSLTAR